MHLLVLQPNQTRFKPMFIRRREAIVLVEAADAVERDWTAPEQYGAEKIAGELAQHFSEVYERCVS